jgi:hypothetical protein
MEEESGSISTSVSMACNCFHAEIGGQGKTGKSVLNSLKTYSHFVHDHVQLGGSSRKQTLHNPTDATVQCPYLVLNQQTSICRHCNFFHISYAFSQIHNADLDFNLRLLTSSCSHSHSCITDKHYLGGRYRNIKHFCNCLE